MTTELKQKRLDPYFAVFNCHINDARERADKEFKAQFGEEKWKEEIKPLHDEGIMVIFQAEPTSFVMAWAALCTAYVNEDKG